MRKLGYLHEHRTFTYVCRKLILSYPLWKGQLEVGNEYTASQMLNDFNINMATIGNSNTKSDEKNMAGFVTVSQLFGKSP